MRVQSPVGTFPVRIVGVRLDGSSPRFKTAMGAWQSELALERSDGPLLAAAVGLLVLAFAAGRRSRDGG